MNLFLCPLFSSWARSPKVSEVLLCQASEGKFTYRNENASWLSVAQWNKSGQKVSPDVSLWHLLESAVPSCRWAEGRIELLDNGMKHYEMKACSALRVGNINELIRCLINIQSHGVLLANEVSARHVSPRAIGYFWFPHPAPVRARDHVRCWVMEL